MVGVKKEGGSAQFRQEIIYWILTVVSTQYRTCEHSNITPTQITKENKTINVKNTIQ